MTKKVLVEFEQVRVCIVTIDMKDLDSYMSNFLALKNHERNTSEILDVCGFNNSNLVDVVLLIDEDENEKSEIAKCQYYVGQFGDITETKVQNAWILNDSYFPSLGSRLGDDEWYVYDKH